jgi:hypothetical protein
MVRGEDPQPTHRKCPSSEITADIGTCPVALMSHTLQGESLKWPAGVIQNDLIGLIH